MAAHRSEVRPGPCATNPRHHRRSCRLRCLDRSTGRTRETRCPRPSRRRSARRRSRSASIHRRPRRTLPAYPSRFFVMMLMTPFTAFAPHTEPPGPLMTSMRSTSSSSTSWMSQNVPEKSGEYTLRPSMSTSSLFAVVLLKPRAVIAHCVRTHLRDLEIRREPQRLRDTRRTGATDLVIRDDLNRGRSLGELLGLFRNRCDVDLHQLLDAQSFELDGGWDRVRCLRRRAARAQRTRECYARCNEAPCASCDERSASMRGAISLPVRVPVETYCPSTIIDPRILATSHNAQRPDNNIVRITARCSWSSTHMRIV